MLHLLPVEWRCLGSGSNLVTKRWAMALMRISRLSCAARGGESPGSTTHLSLCYKENSRLRHQQTWSHKTHTHTHGLDLLHPRVLYSTDLHLFHYFFDLNSPHCMTNHCRHPNLKINPNSRLSGSKHRFPNDTIVELKLHTFSQTENRNILPNVDSLSWATSTPGWERKKKTGT